MALPPYPVIVLPGITANNLRDEYPLPPETIWSVPTRDYERASLHPDNLRLEAIEPARVRVDQLFEVVYSELIEELRYNLREEEDKTVPVFPFPYDWRQPLDDIELQLGEFITEVIERTKLLRHYDRAGYADDPKVNLVGHSMGGLIIAGYLQRAGKKARVHKIATLAAPYRGSFEAVIKITTGTGDLGTAPPSSREREAARMTPALYHLLPSFKKGLEVDDGIPANLFNPDAWQKSIIDTIEEYVRLRGLERANRREQADALFKQMLDLGRRHRLRIEKLALGDAKLAANDWLCVVGVNSKTRVRLKIVKDGGGPQFSFRSEDRVDSWGTTDPTLLHRTGDGTVPLEGALPAFLPREKIVCVTQGDFGYWELGDRALSGISGFHGLLPTMDMVHRLIVRHFTGRPDTRDNTWGWPAPGVENAAWDPPLTLRNKHEKLPG